jgi:hypothetical protein
MKSFQLSLIKMVVLVLTVNYGMGHYQLPKLTQVGMWESVRSQDVSHNFQNEML